MIEYLIYSLKVFTGCFVFGIAVSYVSPHVPRISLLIQCLTHMEDTKVVFKYVIDILKNLK